jgi:diaminohydroxyphosphoribosylaminopyrimidine deaminase/5-amino-6-(5-phosphoribosylamino)uracil reductase
MADALALARSHHGLTRPNPSVGCVLVSAAGVRLGGAVTGVGGRPHAEEVLLATLGEAAVGASAYVTLEPCGGRSTGAPGCAARLIAARVARVVVAAPDPHPTASGGLAQLRGARIAVSTGVDEAEALRLYGGFFHRVATGRPLVHLSADGAGHEAPFDLLPRESFPEALDRMGAGGFSDVWVRPGTPLAGALRAAGLLQGG